MKKNSDEILTTKSSPVFVLVSLNILISILSLFASSGLQRFSYLEQVFFSTSFAGLLSQKKASGKLSLNIQKSDTDLNFLLFRSVSLSFLFFQAENKIADINKE